MELKDGILSALSTTDHDYIISHLLVWHSSDAIELRKGFCFLYNCVRYVIIVLQRLMTLIWNSIDSYRVWKWYLSLNFVNMNCVICNRKLCFGNLYTSASKERGYTILICACVSIKKNRWSFLSIFSYQKLVMLIHPLFWNVIWWGFILNTNQIWTSCLSLRLLVKTIL
jgi:hypothetical protein